jgi:hypothetical protein
MVNDQSDWILRIEVARRLGVRALKVPLIAKHEGIRVKRIQGTFPKYYRPDVEALARRCVENGEVPEPALVGSAV